MSFANISTGFLVAADEHAIDETHHWLLPETAEWVFGLIGAAIVLAAFWKLGVFRMIGKGLKDRTDKIQGQLDESSAARSSAQTEAADIRQAAGDIESERSRLLTEADAQAEAVLADGRVRLADEVNELELRTNDEIAAATARSGDELHGEIARLSGAAAEALVGSALDDATQQRLIEDFIANVGRTGVAAGATS